MMMNSRTAKQQQDDDPDGEHGSEGNGQSSSSALPTKDRRTFVTKVEENDVLLGRGAPVIQNTGNSKFRALVQTRKDDYARAHRHVAKDTIARQVVQEITETRGGKFLRRVSTLAERRKLCAPEDAAVWVVVDDGTALEKTKQTLREKDHPRSADRTAATEEIQSIPPSQQPNWGLFSGTGLHPRDASPSSIYGYGTSADDQLALLMMQPQQQQLPGLLGGDSLAQQMMNLQQHCFSQPFLPQTRAFHPSVDDQLALLMLQRHRAAGLIRFQQQIASLQAGQASVQRQSEGLSLTPLPYGLQLEQQLAQGRHPYVSSVFQLPLLQPQQMGLGSSSPSSSEHGVSQGDGNFATAGVGTARRSPLHREGDDGKDPASEQQKDPPGTAVEQLPDEEKWKSDKRANLQSVTVKRKASDDKSVSSSESACSSISSSSRSSVVYAKPSSPKKSKP